MEVAPKRLLQHCPQDIVHIVWLALQHLINICPYPMAAEGTSTVSNLIYYSIIYEDVSYGYFLNEGGEIVSVWWSCLEDRSWCSGSVVRTGEGIGWVWSEMRRIWGEIVGGLGWGLEVKCGWDEEWRGGVSCKMLWDG